MRLPETLNLLYEDTIIAAYAERANGPGWENSPLWVIIQSRDGKLRRECIEPEEQTQTIRALYATADAVHSALLSELRGSI